ncbi:MAG: FeoB-associated Cys-rich membrane protein [Bacteroidetes bacterium]|nr:MAG: FeoB-associated Cys-rich membrane protein [Bacteroidota bacterium]
MIQWILTIVIVVAALFYAVFRIVKYFRKPAKTKPDECSDCSSDCSHCPLYHELQNPAGD